MGRTRALGALTLTATVLSVMVAAATAQGRGPDADVRAAIEAANNKFMAAAAKGDAATLASLYTPDAEAFPPNADIVKGRAALQKMWQGVLASGIGSMELTTSEVESAGDLAYEVGTYAMKTKDGKVADRGKYVVVWKRVNGQWLLHRDIWSTNMPATTK
jgi:uncharacterized protein (TIGR02246 family)